ncbi:MAG: alpha/beta hydrolase [Gammaproteobacteria bacterium]|nr:alpha/beta hydrolase [Gammaproteobacteria bacterium]MDH4253055.1 alpha/beta hydrolase [Gammaproteobacteria bacterium]MDH5308523.1 alpha/beta hydrolase [Gammaproteobacteria bacterium]
MNSSATARARRGPRTRLLALAALAATGAAVAYVASPATLSDSFPAPTVHGDPAAWIADSERRVAAATPIVPGTEKRVLWLDPDTRARTTYAVVYLHGFSATRQEVAPFGELLAGALGANLFETRLSGHGLLENPLAGVRAEDWLEDAAEALAIGAALGDHIVLTGTSTGATLALALSGHESFEAVSAVLLLSPNFAPADGRAEFLTWPGGRLLAEMLVGETRSWTPWNELQGRYWATSYPTAATVEMMRLVKYVRSRLPLEIDAPILAFYSPSDTVVDVDRLRAGLARIRAPRLQSIEIQESGDPSNHVLAGDILAPGNSHIILEHTVRFLRESGL